MDAGTGFSSQVYELSPVFLHKEWIMEQWEKNYYIMSLAGATNGSALVDMILAIFYILTGWHPRLWNNCMAMTSRLIFGLLV
ncbi:casein kinase 1-like protein HD16 isoform X2 [Rutidosis leptorrhynchoides]|uniref:casein kinase 1-like protein HD16 isoform X2 n=1 Tax=Rutidosis leptorrhynchoides TaxID=125765 RepID=UPI003A9A2BEF